MLPLEVSSRSRSRQTALTRELEFIPGTIINFCKLHKFINNFIIINLYAGS